jgi:exodeoxyribonuclease V alpha subunit
MITALARHYYDFMRRFAPQAPETVWLTASLAVQVSQEGHSCLDLRNICGQDINTHDEEAEPGVSADRIRLPDLEKLVEQLLASGVVGEAATSYASDCPFVLNNYLLYLRRNWQYENSLAFDLNDHCWDWQNADFDKLSAGLTQLFPPINKNTIDWQRVAAAVCALKGLCVISGGPGTGKTFTVARIISLLQMLAAPASLRIALTAPTGKAASRLAESISRAVSSLNLSPAVIPQEAGTIHRLLGSRGKSPYFRHNRHNKLNIDVLIVDEVSMVDLALMAKLLAAVPVGARIILLGDKDQLASVESGRVMGDICGEVRANNFSASFAEQLRRVGGIGDPPAVSDTRSEDLAAIDDSVVFLTKSYRFGIESGIGELAAATIAGQTDRAIACFSSYQDLTLFPTRKEFHGRILQGYGPLFNCQNPAAAFDAFSKFQILCVLREGESGIRYINQYIADVMRQEGLIHGVEKWYRGRPIMITGNNYGLGLFNGDIGITMPDDKGQLRVFFKSGDKLRGISCARIPAHETAFAITVHKSQGSEFSEVLLMLPTRQSPVLSRELLYTAVTRAKSSFELWGDEEIFKQAMARRVGRTTGLRERLIHNTEH